MSGNAPALSELCAIAAIAARRLMGHQWRVWFWGDSIGVEGLLDTSQLLRQPEYENFVYGLLKAWIARREPGRPWDYTAPGLGLLRVYDHTSDPSLLTVAKQHAEYLAGFRQTVEGSYVRYAEVEFDLPPELPSDHPEAQVGPARSRRLTQAGPCIFVDSMHFDAPFYAKLFRTTGNERWRGLAIGNIMPHIRLLFDENRDLFHHFWIEARNARNGVLWGRGQGWALLGIVHTLEALDQSDPAVPALVQILQRHCNALTKAQDPSGHWHTVVDDPSSYLETSVAAFVVDGFSRAIGRGWISSSLKPVADRALQALIKEIKPDGTLDGVSYETYPSLSAEHYKKMPRGAMVPWGQGPLLTAIYSYSELAHSS